MQELKKKLSENLKKIEIWKRIRFLIIVLAIALFACHPYLNKMVIYSHDIGYHLNRINEICKQLIMGNFPATIHTELVNGLGYANSLFYPELFLYIPAMLIYFLKIDLLTSYKFFIVIITFFTFLSMYYSSILIFKKKQIAWLSALLYTFSLYRLTDIYVRGALGEILALVFFPLIISGLYEIIFGENKRWWVVVIGLFGLANSHILSFVMAIPIILILCLANIDKIFKDKNILKHLFIAAIVAIITTIGFFGPLIEQKCNDKFFVDEQTIDEPSDLKERATSIDLALRNQLKMGDGINGNYTDETLSEGVGIILLMLPILILFKKGISYKNNRFEIQILVIAFITYMISTKLFPWEKIEFLTIIQFPFRLNIIPTTLLALVAADAFYNFMREKNDTTTLLTIVILLITASQLDGFDINSRNEPIEQLLTNNYGFGEYLPEGMKLDDLDLYEINNKENKIEFSRTGNTITFYYESSSSNDQINIPLTYYKGYIAYIENNDGKHDLTVSKNTENGHVLVLADKSISGTITVKYKMTYVQKICYSISAISVCVLGIYIILNIRKKD